VFLQAALAETSDAVVEALDKLITTVHGKAKKRRDELLRASEEATRRIAGGAQPGSKSFSASTSAASCCTAGLGLRGPRLGPARPYR